MSAEDEAKAMGDEYVSVEHLFLSLMKYPNTEIKKLFQAYGITRERFLQALSTVRGNQKVVSDNPEATYETLEKYGYDLVERANFLRFFGEALILRASQGFLTCFRTRFS